MDLATLKAGAPFLLLILFFYFVIIRPQKKQQDKRKAFMNSLRKGDYVITAGGIFGVIKKISGNIVTLQIAPGLNVEVDKRALQQAPADSLDEKGADDVDDEDDDDYDDEPEDADSEEQKNESK